MKGSGEEWYYVNLRVRIMLGNWTSEMLDRLNKAKSEINFLVLDIIVLGSWLQ